MIHEIFMKYWNIKYSNNTFQGPAVNSEEVELELVSQANNQNQDLIQETVVPWLSEPNNKINNLVYWPFAVCSKCNKQTS